MKSSCSCLALYSMTFERPFCLINILKILIICVNCRYVPLCDRDTLLPKNHNLLLLKKLRDSPNSPSKAIGTNSPFFKTQGSRFVG